MGEMKGLVSQSEMVMEGEEVLDEGLSSKTSGKRSSSER